MKDVSKIAFALGLAQKAGKLASGDTAVQYAVKAGKVHLLLLANDASENSRKYALSMAENYEVPIIDCLNKATLGSAIGKAQRTAVAVLDKNFSEMIKKHCDVFD